MKEIFETVTRDHYKYLLLVWFVLFLAVTIWLNELYIVGALLFKMPVIIQYPFVFFFILNALLGAVSLNLAISRIKTIQKAKQQQITRQAENQVKTAGTLGVSFIGTFFGILGGACPGCIAGLFPIIMGLFGSRFALVQLPLFGIELQMIGTVLLLLGIYMLSRPIVCKI